MLKIPKKTSIPKHSPPKKIPISDFFRNIFVLELSLDNMVADWDNKWEQNLSFIEQENWLHVNKNVTYAIYLRYCTRCLFDTLGQSTDYPTS